jgi:hypothetical protein
MAQRVRRNDYAGLVTGVCGHMCDKWPQTSDRRSGEPMAICDTCDDWVLVAPKGQLPGQLLLVTDDEIPY